MRLKRNRGMSAEEFSRRMAVHQQRADELGTKMQAQTRVVQPFLDTYIAARGAGVRITRWHLTRGTHDALNSVGLAGDRILGYPVVVDR